jgi:intracellular septation protein
MKPLYDLFSIIIFFIVFKFYGIYPATVSAMIVSLCQFMIIWLFYRKIDKGILCTLIIIMALGGATLISHNARFIEWKPTVIYWVFATGLFYSQIFLEKPIIQRLLETKIALPNAIWKRLNLTWGLFFLTMGLLNLYVAYHYSENTWVNFKLFGTLGLTILLIILQTIYMAKHVKQ